MFKLVYEKRYQNQVYTKYGIQFPEEDFYYTDNNFFCVADGVTRDLIGGEIRPYPKTKEDAKYIAAHYPNPSGAYESSKIIATNFVKYIKSDKKEINKRSIKKAIQHANKDVWVINKNRKIDYVGEDLYCSVAVGGAITEDFLYCFSIGDCYIKVFDEEKNEIFTTENDHQIMEQFEEDFLKKGLYSWMDPRSRILIRAGVRNNFVITYNGKKVGFGALTGEETAIDFVKIYKVPLKNAKYICAYSDGCMQYFENKSEAEKTLENPDRIKKVGSERTLLVFVKE